MSSKAGGRRLIVAAAVAALVSLGAAGCAQERLSVSDTCDEINAIAAEANATGTRAADDPELAKKASQSMDELAERGAEQLQKPIQIFADKLGGDVESALTPEEQAASDQIDESCGF